MKIIQLITGTTTFGGAEAHVRDLAIGLRARGHECTVMGPSHGLLVDQLRANNVPLVSIPALKKTIHPLWDLVSLFQVIIAARRLRPDIIATHTSKAGLVGRIAAKLIGVPSFFTPHGLSFVDRQNGKHIRFRLAMERLALRLGSTMIAVCEAEHKIAIDHLKIKESRIATIHNCLPDLHLRHKRNQGRVVITMIARFDVQKDHTTLFQALARLLHLEWELRLCGSGPMLSWAKALVQEYGLSSRVSFLNQCSEIPLLLAQSDIFTLITNWEAFPISILEAMRAGLPVIATDIGGVCEAVEDEVNGFLVHPRDPVQLAERLALLITSNGLRRNMGARSRRRFSQNFEWRAMLDKTEVLYATAAKYVRAKEVSQ
jgi:glycosyltransferase involved in cell wall biosynthesis